MDPLKHLTGTSEIYDFVGNDEYPLRLKIGELRALQTELNSGPSQILSRLQHGEWMVDDVIETIRCALIGGGMSHKDAKRLVTEYVIDGHLMVYQTAHGAALMNSIEPHDVAVLDLNLGRGNRDGVDAALEIIRDHPHTRIIFQTAHADPLNFKRMWTVCPEAILDKPINEAALLKAVAGQNVEAA